MTCLEKLKIEHPEFAKYSANDNEIQCPDHYGYVEASFKLCPDGCEECWSREADE